MPFVHFIFTSGTCPGPWWGNSRGNGARGRGQTMLNESRLVLNSLELSWRNSNMLELSRTIMIWIDMDWYSILELILDPGSFVCVHVCSFQKYNISRGYPVPPWLIHSVIFTQHISAYPQVPSRIHWCHNTSMIFHVFPSAGFHVLWSVDVASCCLSMYIHQLQADMNAKKGWACPPHHSYISDIVCILCKLM